MAKSETTKAAGGAGHSGGGGDESLNRMAEEIFGMAVATWRQRVASRREAANELSESQYLTLDTLVRSTTTQQVLTVGELQRSIGVLPAQMSRIIRSLESGFESV